MSGFIWLIIVGALYFLPAINAYYFTKHNNASAIAVLNLFLGWTLIGWVAALIWSYTANRKTEVRQ